MGTMGFVSFQRHTFLRSSSSSAKKRALLLLIVIVPLAFISGCAGVVSAQHTQPVAPAPQLALSNTTVNFGNVAVGSKGTITVTMSNSGNADLTVSATSVAGSAFSLSGMTFPATISAGNSSTLTVSFSPASEGTISGSLSITSNASSSPISVSLTGIGMQTGLSLSSASINFGNVTMGKSGTQSVTLTNSGNANLVVNLATVTGTGFGVSGLALPVTILPSQNLTFSVQFSPASAGPASGNIVFTDNAPNSPQALTLSGAGVATTAALTTNPTSIAFGNVTVGGNSKQPVTLTNTGNASITISQVAASGAGFSLSGMTTPMTLQAGQNTNLTAQFAPSGTGNASGSITITSGASDPTVTVALTGAGTQAVLAASPSSFNFGSVLVGSSGTQSFTLTNSGTAAVNISGITVAGTGYSLSGVSTPLTLNPGQNTSFTAKLAPVSAGNLPGTISIASNAPGSPLTISLSGTGTQAQPQLTITPPSVAFGSVAVGSTGSQNVSLSNTGNAALTITAVTPSGTGFGVSGLAALPLTLNAGQSTSFTSTFAPTSSITGATGSISITSNAPGSPAKVALTGSGIQGSLSGNPASINFGNVLVGSNGSQPITLTNSGTASITISAAAATGTSFSLTGLAAPLTLTAGQTTTFTATFTPASAASSSGSISITSSAPGSPLIIPLTGAGIQPQMSALPASVSFGTVVDGSNASQSITLKNAGTATLTISQATVSGSGFTISGLTLPATVAAGASTSFTALFTPTGSGAVSGSILLTSNAPASPLTIALSGTAATATGQLSANPASYNFGNVMVGSSGTQSITLTNSGNASVTISAATATGAGFSLTGLSVPLTLNASQSTTLTATFRPTSGATAGGSLSIVSNASGSPLAIALTGTGVQPQISALPASVSFGTVVDGSNTSQSITLKNAGTASLTISQATVSGSGFTISGLTLPATVAAGASTSFTALFTPTGSGTVSGSILLTSNAPNSPLTVALSGSAATATKLLGTSPASLSFGTVNVNSSSPLSTTLTNNGNSNVTISSVAITGSGFADTGVAANTVLTPNQSITLNVTYAPTAAGNVTGSVTVSSNATNSPLTISLSGTGAQPVQHSASLTWTASSSTLAGYNVYRGSVSGGPYTLMNSSLISATDYTDSTVQSGQTYYYVTTAVNSSGNESVNSNEVTATIP
jgi:hypothetical protein